MIASMEENYVNLKGSGHVLHFYKSLKWVRFCGPVAQLGARFHGMEAVKGSNPFRSTKTFQTLTGLGPPNSLPVESNWSPNPI